MSEGDTKLKRPRGSLLRAIRAGITPAPAGYMTADDMKREDEAKRKAKAEKQVADRGGDA